MQHVAVDSTSIRFVDYDEARRRLEVEFLSGARYRYDGVGPAVFQRLVDAESVGAYFNANVRDRYPYARLGERPRSSLTRRPSAKK